MVSARHGRICKRSVATTAWVRSPSGLRREQVHGPNGKTGVPIRTFAFTVLLIAGGAFATASAQRASCDSVPPDDAHPYQAALRAELAGTFRVVLIRTVRYGPADTIRTFEQPVTLSVADSAQRATAQIRTIGHFRRVDLQLVGSGQSAPGGTKPAEVDAGTLFLGCRDCTDGSPTIMGIRGVTPRGFFGTWHDFQTGIGRVIGPDGKPGADPEGYYCAMRVTAPE